MIEGYPYLWLVFNGKSYLQMDDLGVPLFQETSVYVGASALQVRRV